MFSCERNLKFHIPVLAVLVAFGILASSIPAARAQGTFVSFDAPGAGTGQSQGTFPMAINRSGLIVGYFTDSSGMEHGFMRAPDGTFTTVDVPGALGTQITAVNSRGLVAGYSFGSSGSQGFLRYRNGMIVTIQPPRIRYVDPIAMNDVGEVAGIVEVEVGVGQGFVWSTAKGLTTFRPPNAGSFTSARGLNSGGEIAGNYSDDLAQRKGHAFLRDKAGNFTSFDAQDGDLYTVAAAINASGQITGWYVDASYEEFPFLRDADGTIMVFTVGGGQGQATSINDAGVLVGTAYNTIAPPYENAFERDAAGNVTPLTLPFSNIENIATGINLSGRIVGSYIDQVYTTHGWLMTP